VGLLLRQGESVERSITVSHRLIDQNREPTLFRVDDDRPSYAKGVAKPEHNVQRDPRLALGQIVDVHWDRHTFGEPLLQKLPGDPLEFGDLILRVFPGRQV